MPDNLLKNHTFQMDIDIIKTQNILKKTPMVIKLRVGNKRL